MKSIINYFIQNEIAGNILMVFLLIMGYFGLMQMQTTFFPETESRVINIRAIYPGASPAEIEEGVVSRIEENLKGVTGIERTSSVSAENSGTLTVEVIKGYDTDIVLQDVKNAVESIPSLPIGLEPIVVFKRESLGNALSFSIDGDVDLRTLKQYAREVEKDLLAMENLSKVTLSGFPEEEIEVSFREADLRRYNMTFDQAATALAGANVEITGGTIKTNKEELLIRASNKEYYAKDLENTVVRTNENGGMLRLYQIADIVDKWEDQPNRTYFNSKASVVIDVQNTLEEDMLSINEKTKAYIEEFNQTHDDVQANITLDWSISLKDRIKLLRDNGIIGFIIVIILLAMFLHYRLAFWVALAIPISFAGMFICVSLLGVTINVVSLFGMIVVIGILVDDGIVIGENIYQHYEKGASPKEAALNGTMEVLPAVFAAIVTTVVAFSTFFFIDGRLGDIFRDLATVVIFSLIFSLVEGALILPAHIAHSKALKTGGKGSLVTKYLDKLMYLLRDKIYDPILRFSVNYSLPIVAICVSGMFIVIGALQGGIIKSTFFPVLPRDNFAVNLKLPAGSREELTLEVLDKIEKAAFEVSDEFSESHFNGEMGPITKVEKKLGPTTYQGNLRVSLMDGETRGDLTARTILNRLREKVGPVYEAEVLTYGSSSVFGKPVSISLLSKNSAELDLAVQELKGKLNQISDLKDIVDNNQEGLKEISLQLKPKAHNLGFTLREIMGHVRKGFFGAEVQRLQRGVDEVKVWVRYKLEDRSNISNLADMRIRSADGNSVSLSELVTFNTERGVININHIDGQREVRIEADVSNDKVSVSDVTGDIENELIPEVLAKYSSVSVGFEGQQRQTAKTQKSMQLVLPIILMVMFFIITLTFKSISQALIVFALIPFGFIGVGMGHYLRDLPISLFSALGMIALIGIIVNDALVFITTFNDRIKEGMPFEEAVIASGKSRFRPILLTSLTTIAGLYPLILEKSFQAQFLIPMAISVAYGLMIGTFILLVLIPALLVIVNRIKRTALSIWEGETVPKEMVEPASPTRRQNIPLYLFAALATLVGFVAYVMFAMEVTGMFWVS